MTKKLEILKNSLVKKEQRVAAKLDAHYADVKSGNGQPMNDKRNGQATLKRWDRQTDGIRLAITEIEKTKKAIEKEQAKIADVENQPLPLALKSAVERGELSQWRKFPNRFFVRGVERARIIWEEDQGKLLCSYASEIPNDEQYQIFKNTFRRLQKEIS